MSEHILVGVDGSPSSLAAVDLAAHEANLRGCPLHIIHADPPSGQADAATPQQLMQVAVERATAAEPDIKVTGEVLAGQAAPVLIDASSHAVLVVLGHRGIGGFTELLLGSVSAQLAAHAHAPVIVVRGDSGNDGGGRVVVGVDGSTNNDPAIEFAFAEADRRALEVLAIHAVTGAQFTGPSDALIYDRRSEEARAVGLLCQAITKWHEQFPDLLVQRQVRWAAPAQTLITASTTAQLIVVGRRGSGGFHELRLGSITHALLHHAACPVAVVPAAVPRIT